MDIQHLLGYTVQGLENHALDELEQITGSRGETIAPGRIRIPADSSDMLRTNYLSGTCSRFCILLDQFSLQEPADAYDQITADPTAIMDSDQTFAVRVHRQGDHDFRSPDIAQEAGQKIVDRFEDKTGTTPDVDLDNPDIVFRFDLFQDQAYLSVDTTGTSLAERDYLRGSRDDRTSPILANILVRASGWEEDQRLLDPFCRAGTIPIEAGRIACNIPNAGRPFAFLDLAFVDRQEYAQIAQNAKQAMDIHNLPIEGSDPDPSGATMSAKASGFDEMQFQQVHALERDLDADTIIFRSPFVEQRSKRNEIAEVMEQFEDQLLTSSIDHATCFTQDRNFFSQHDTEQRASWQHMDGWVLTWDT